MRLAVLIDYDNLLKPHRSAGILDLVTRVLFKLPKSSNSLRGSCDVRLYGGWYEGTAMTQSAQDLTVDIRGEFPAIIRVPGEQVKTISLVANAELAMALMEEPAHHLFGTYRKKGRPSNLRVQTPAAIGCADTGCPLPMTKKLLKTGRCPASSCVLLVDDLVYRHEQKIVDTMLACDLVYASQQGYDQIILISGDDDFVPPIRAALLRGANVTRFHPKPNNQRIPLSSTGPQALELDL